MNNKENKFLNQDLKNQEVDIKELDKIANGAISTNTFIKIYLKEYEKTKFNSEKEIIPLIKPSKEKISIEDVLTEILVFIFEINSEKQIFFLNKSSPKFLIAKDTLENKSKNCDNKKYEKFIQIPHIISLIRKLLGFSIWWYVTWESKYLKEKYNSNPKSKEFEINKIPLVVEVPKIFSKLLSLKISELTNVISSNKEYKLLSIEPNKLPKIVFIVSIIICVISVFSNFPPN